MLTIKLTTISLSDIAFLVKSRVDILHIVLELTLRRKNNDVLKKALEVPNIANKKFKISKKLNFIEFVLKDAWD